MLVRVICSYCCSRDEVFKLLEKSTTNRRTAGTDLNEKSSRSHCVVTITVHTKETDAGGEDIIKTVSPMLDLATMMPSWVACASALTSAFRLELTACSFGCVGQAALGRPGWL